MKKFLSLFLIVICPYILYAQGMWMPHTILEQKASLKSAGIQIDVSELYNENKPGYNDAVALFGGGCTGGLVSKDGLLFTNHHCGYGQAQSLSTPQRNILEGGFWAKSRSEELPCPGLTVSFVRRIEMVTNKILAGVNDKTSETDRLKIIEKNKAELEKSYSKVLGLKVEVKPYYDGNEYWATILEEYTDVRLVAFPPNGIGKFGGDTDNWMWPRHTGDFAVFRVYSNAQGQPSAYSPSNVPYHPKKHFAVSTKGVKEGDFSMVYGFPGRTTQYISSFQVDLIQNVINPIRIDMRTIKLNIWDKSMRADKNIFLKYASKQASISNGWKKWQGENRGLQLNNVIGLKQIKEENLQAKFTAKQSPDVDLLAKMEALILANTNVVAASEIIRESVLSIELISAASILNRALNTLENDKLSSNEKIDILEKVKKSYEGFNKNYELKLDKEVFEALMPIYFNAKGVNALSPELENIVKRYYNNDFEMWSDFVYNNSMLVHPEMMERMTLDRAGEYIKLIKNDPAFIVYNLVQKHYADEIKPKLDTYNLKLNEYNRAFVLSQIYNTDDYKNLYPDANQTLRLSYGPVKGIKPYMSNEYSFITTLDQVIAKTNPEIEEFNTPKALLDLYNNKDFGRWATVNGQVPVNFLTQNHTSGGNSGSPVLNAKGELIGINFDRIWDGTMSDIYFDPNLCRNIVVDVRYVLFVLEKYGKMDWLIKELDLK